MTSALRTPQSAIVKCLSVRQPWAWLIVAGGKDIENRTWATSHRGLLAIHAAGGMSDQEYLHCQQFARERGVTLPPPSQLKRGGIVGLVELTACLRSSASPWFEGPVGWLLANPRPLAFVPMRGQLSIFQAQLPAEIQL
jgi:hypothetical protein